MSLWQFMATQEGFNLFNSSDPNSGVKPPTDDEFEAAISAYL